MSTCEKPLLAFPDSDDVVAQPLNAWKNLNSKDWSGPKLLAIWWKGINLSDFATPNSIKIYLRVPVNDVKDVFDNLHIRGFSLWSYTFRNPFALSKAKEQFAKNNRLLWTENILNKILFLSYNSKWMNKFLYCI